MPRSSSRTEDAVTLDERGARRVLRCGRTDSVGWDELVEVRVFTTAGGPEAEDVFFVLVGDGDAGCVIPQGLAPVDVLERLQALPGFDNLAFIAAMGSIEAAQFVCWRRS